MKKGDRLRAILLGGKPVVKVDCGQIMHRLVYSPADALPPSGDHYVIPVFEEHWQGIKKVISSMFFVEEPISRFPKGAGNLFPRYAN